TTLSLPSSFFHSPATTEIYTLSLHDALPIFAIAVRKVQDNKTGLWYDVPNMPNEPGNYAEASASCMLAYTFAKGARKGYLPGARSEEHTSELQSRENLVCRLLLEKKKKKKKQ